MPALRRGICRKVSEFFLGGEREGFLRWGSAGCEWKGRWFANSNIIQSMY